MISQVFPPGRHNLVKMLKMIWRTSRLNRGVQLYANSSSISKASGGFPKTVKHPPAREPGQPRPPRPARPTAHRRIIYKKRSEQGHHPN